jgi:peptidoglycan/xylan/chitin deacetylase (PgdA/CDA1 family)
MGRTRRRSGRFPLAVLLAAALAVTPSVVHADPGAPTPSDAASQLPAGPWPPSEVLATDPSTVALPRASAQVANTCPATGSGVNRTAPGSGRTVALTFDDGPGVSTDAIIRILRDHGVTATFFNIGINQSTRPATVRGLAANGFLLANHTWSHPDMATLSSSAQAAEMDRASAQQASIVGSHPCFFRPPYGSYDSTTLSIAQSRRMSVWNWSVDTEDWKAAGSGSSTWVNRIVSLAQAGGSQAHPVVLMHNSPTGNPATVSALPTIIRFYRDRGYTFVDLTGRTAGRLPFGSFDNARADGTGRLTVSGWTIDPDTPTTPTRVHIYVDGRGTAITADGSRPDVGAAHPGTGSSHGFSAAFQATPGAHSVCVHAVDTSTSSRTIPFGCRTVTVSPSRPIGSLDTVVAAPGGLDVSGWTIDRDTPTVSTRVHVYVDGRGTAITADRSRPDVGAAHPGAGPLHGFGVFLPTGPGSHSVCVHGIDTSFASLSTPLGCRTVTTS